MPSGDEKRAQSGRRREGGAFKTCSRVLKIRCCACVGKRLSPISGVCIRVHGSLHEIAFLSPHRISFRQNETNKVGCCLLIVPIVSPCVC